MMRVLPLTWLVAFVGAQDTPSPDPNNDDDIDSWRRQLSPAPTTYRFTGETTEPQTTNYPSPGSTTEFDIVYIYRDTGCAGFCDTPLNQIAIDSECECDGETCADGTDKYLKCCDYVDVCLDKTTTPPITSAGASTTPAKVTTVKTTTPKKSTTETVCPECIFGSNCDDIGQPCGILEEAFSCNCQGCACTVVSTEESITTKHSTTPKASPTTAAPTTAHVSPTTAGPTTAEATTPGLTTACGSNCFGLSCDDWVPFGDKNFNTRCAYLEKAYGCDCNGCTCDDKAFSTTSFGVSAPAPLTTVSTTTTTTTVATEAPDFNFGIDTAVVAGGYSNSVLGMYSVIGGGRANIDTATYDVAVGGVLNTLRSNYASVGGGYQNTVSGRFGSIPGGRSNSVAGRHSVVLGSQASTKATTDGTAVDHVLVMNFLKDGGSTKPTTVSTPNTISLQAESILLNDVDMLASMDRVRRLSDSQNEIDGVVQRIHSLKQDLEQKLSTLRRFTKA